MFLLTLWPPSKHAILRGMNETPDKQILFGDLHVHTTFSTDAFLWSLPIYGGEGAHPLADACDYARHCSALDFWSITDHAEVATPKRWEQTKESIRACNAVSNNGDNPDMVSFVGFEWTQVGQLPEDHFGHKNVIFKGLEDAELAKRPIASGGVAVNALRTNGKDLIPLPLAFGDFKNRQNYFDIRRFLQEAAEVDLCDPDTPIADLPASCFEVAETPGALVDSLEAQKLDPLIIPHGTTWGFYTPVGVTFDKHLKAENRPEKMELVEVMSGHGNSEEYRSFRGALNIDSDALDGGLPCADALNICPCVGAPAKSLKSVAWPMAMGRLNAKHAPNKRAILLPCSALQRIFPFPARKSRNGSMPGSAAIAFCPVSAIARAIVCNMRWPFETLTIR